jgi:DNA (cytosine-5)-methyltransferase 1
VSGLAFYEFFAGGGMARLGLGPAWTCLFANDFDAAKAAAYEQNHGAGVMRCADVAGLGASDLPGRADLAWASFPCQDLSLAGVGRGLGSRGANTATRSGALWSFWRLIEALRREGRAPPVVALENVAGLLTSARGEDFTALIALLAEGGYRAGALVMDAADFLPQSRPRVFVVAVDAAVALPAGLVSPGPGGRFAPPALQAAHARLPRNLAARWIWWRAPPAPGAPSFLVDLVEAAPSDVSWDSAAMTGRFVDQMSASNRAKLDAALASGTRVVGTLYRRTRAGPDGGRQVRSEVRFDGVAGCLRTPGGGSSRQRLLIVDDGAVRSRLVSGREAARLMGIPDSYRLPPGYTAAYHLAGDGVAVPVVRHLARQLLEPLAWVARGSATLAA